MKRNPILFLGALMLVLAALGYSATRPGAPVPSLPGSHEAPLPRCPRCNVILITVDALRADHVGLYGYGLDTTPVLDNFFGTRGIILDNLFSAASWTLPSHAALFASQMPSALKVEAIYDRFSPNTPLVSDVFRAAGYATKAFNGGVFAVAQPWGFSKGFESVTEVSASKDAKFLFPQLTEWLRGEHKTPFFVFMHTSEVHDKWVAPPPWNRLFGDGSESKEINIKDIVRVNTRPGGWTKEEQAAFARGYDQEARYTDGFFKDFFDTLESRGLLKNTVILITADHGEEFGEHGTIGLHAHTLYDELLHVPGLLYLPSAKPRRLPTRLSLIDVAPTLLDTVGVPIPPSFRGVPLNALLAGGDANRTLLAETIHEKKSLLSYIAVGYELAETDRLTGVINPAPRKDGVHYLRAAAARLGNWKLIHNLDGSFELYDLSRDPDEKANLYEGWELRVPASDRPLVEELRSAVVRQTAK